MKDDTEDTDARPQGPAADAPGSGGTPGGVGLPPAGAPPTGPTARPGLPWEHPETGRSLGSALDTLRLVLFQPATGFARMRISGSLGDPLLFLILFGTVGAFFGMFWQMAFRSTFARLGGGDLSGIAAVNSFGFVMLLMAPLVALLAVAILALIVHAGLMIFGGAPRPLEVTLRTLAYANGATYLFMAIPICGGIVSFFWWIVIAAIGVREAQEVPGGRAVGAVLMPVILVCVCCGIIWALALAAFLSIPNLS